MKKFALLLFPALVSFTTLKADPIDDFWKWFRKNESRLKNFTSDPEKYLNEVMEQAKKIERGLALEFEPPTNGIINLTISADGDSALFPVVKSIVAKAPKIEGWRFIAFRQRVPLDIARGMSLKVGNQELKVEELKFFPMVEQEKLFVIIYVKGINEENFMQVAYSGLLLLDNLLGEYDCVTKIASYDFQDLPKDKKELDELLPLLWLPNFVDKFHKDRGSK